MTPTIIFFIQGAAIALMYLAIRRAWFPIRTVVIGGVLVSAVLMTLRLLTTENADPGLSVLIGVPLGALIGLAVAAIAWYFVAQERNKTQ